jgi:8-oxo-dGTP pyrophosphatase MutT (NUDIX family)
MTIPIQDGSFGIIPVFIEDNKYLFLIVQHTGLHWGFPKGHAEENESIIETMKRELWEETGITECTILEDTSFSYTHIFEKNKNTYQKTNLLYIAFPLSKEIKVPVEWQHEIINAKWCTRTEAKELIKFKPIENMLDEVIEHLDSKQRI